MSLRDFVAAAGAGNLTVLRSFPASREAATFDVDAIDTVVSDPLGPADRAKYVKFCCRAVRKKKSKLAPRLKHVVIRNGVAA